MIISAPTYPWKLSTFIEAHKCGMLASLRKSYAQFWGPCIEAVRTPALVVTTVTEGRPQEILGLTAMNVSN